jgi:alpha-D-ribose 1-methylphosphonate 5-triphosphate synthase subunit PhnG
MPDPLLHTEATRRRWLSVLAKAPVAALEEAWLETGDDVEFRHLREPEVGLCLVRARAGGTGMRFNLGEMTVARCSVRLASGEVGHGYVGGRSRRHAELIALFDAMLQRPGRHAAALGGLVDRLERAQQRRRRELAAKVAPTRVEFFTMVRGEDPA